MRSIMERLFTRKKTTHHFLITSHGQTASMWLAAVFNKIPDVFCSHGYSYPAREAVLDELTSEDVASREASAARFEKLPLDRFFKELRAVSDKPIVGNVLAFYFGRLLCRAGGKIDQSKYSVVNIARHPVTRVTSTIKTWLLNDNDVIPSFIELDFATRCDHMKSFISRQHSVDFTDKKNKVFFVSLLAMEDIANDIVRARENDVVNMRYEDITTNLDDFKLLVDIVTAGKVTLSAEQQNQLFLSKRINAHNNTGISEPDNQFRLWEPWRQDLFKFVFERSEIANKYEGLNYDFSFIK